MENIEEKKEELYNFFKKNLAIDFNSMSTNEAKMIIDQLKNQLNNQISKQEENNKKLSEELDKINNEVLQLMEKLYK